MKLLIVTQVVDRTDPALGFFHRWIVEFAKHVEQIEVVCLFEGEHALPGNVHVHSLGKEKGRAPSFIYALRFLPLVFKLRQKYDVVFVHMNVEYVLLAGPLWKMLQKKIALWYVHGTVSLRLKLAVLLGDVVLTASNESMRVVTDKKRVVGHGIDTGFFAPDARTRGVHLLSAGRLTKSKHHDLIIRACAKANRPLHIVGEGPEEGALKHLAKELGADVTFFGGLSQEALRSEYQSAGAFIHASTTGSMDKVVLEALACGCPVVTTSKVYVDLPVKEVNATPEEIASALSDIPMADPKVIEENFSLSALIPRIVRKLSS